MYNYETVPREADLLLNRQPAMSDNPLEPVVSSTEQPTPAASPQADASHPGNPAHATVSPPEEPKKKKKKKKKKKIDDNTIGSSRGVETMFRSSYRVQMDLSALADAKANIMITINGLILSILLASISPKIDSNPWLLIPTVVMLTTCGISIVYAILAAIPRVSSNVITLEDIRRNRANILFFGNFVNMTRQDFVIGMEEILKEPNLLYHNMINDIYGIGLVLKRKFTLLRTAYLTFMIGIIMSVILYIAVFVSTPSAAGI